MNTSDLGNLALAFSAIALITVIVILVVAPGAPHDLDERLERLECIHRIFEDGSAVHEDAEIVQRLCPELVP